MLYFRSRISMFTSILDKIKLLFMYNIIKTMLPDNGPDRCYQLMPHIVYIYSEVFIEFRPV